MLFCNGLEYGSVELLLNHSCNDPTAHLQGFPARLVETPGELPEVNLDQLFLEPSLDQLVLARVSLAQLSEFLIFFKILLGECMRCHNRLTIKLLKFYQNLVCVVCVCGFRALAAELGNCIDLAIRLCLGDRIICV